MKKYSDTEKEAKFFKSISMNFDEVLNVHSLRKNSIELPLPM